MKKEKQEKKLTPVQMRHKRENAMLRTYFISLMSLILCCAMLFGTTMAWFTSDVTSGTNVLTAGELKAQLLHVVPAADPAAAETVYDLSVDSGHQPFGIMALAPTYSTEATFRVNNLGDLPFTYRVYLNMSVEDPGQTVAEGESLPDPAAEPGETQETAITEEDLAGYFNVYVNGVPAGTMKELMAITNGERSALVGGKLYPTSVVRAENGLTATEDFTVRIELDGSATAAIMGMQLKFNIQLVANQLVEDQASGEQPQPGA